MSDRLSQMEARLAKATTLCEQLDQWADDAPTWNGHRMRAGASAEFAAGMTAAAQLLRETLPAVKAAMRVQRDVIGNSGNDSCDCDRCTAIRELRLALAAFTASDQETPHD